MIWTYTAVSSQSSVSYCLRAGTSYCLLALSGNSALRRDFDNFALRFEIIFIEAFICYSWFFYTFTVFFKTFIYASDSYYYLKYIKIIEISLIWVLNEQILVRI